MEYRLALENRPSARQQVKSLRRQINAECGGIGRWIGATAVPILFGPTFSSSFVSLAAGRTNRKRELSGAIGEPHLSFAEAKMGSSQNMNTLTAKTLSKRAPKSGT